MTSQQAILFFSGGSGGGVSTSYSNTGGTGNRTAIITISTDITAGLGVVTSLIDGTYATDYWWSAGQSGKHVLFDFGTGKVIDEAIWHQDLGVNQGTWQWEGSNNNISYTAIGATFTLGTVNGPQTITTLNGNTTSYRYYRLTQTAGVTTSTPYVTECEFKIS